MSTINDTVRDGMRQLGWSSYFDNARPLVTALEDREREMATALIAYATEAELEEDQVREALANIGLTMPREPEPEPEPVAAESNGEGDDQAVQVLAQHLDRLVARIDTLERVARSRGLI